MNKSPCVSIFPFITCLNLKPVNFAVKWKSDLRSGGGGGMKIQPTTQECIIQTLREPPKPVVVKSRLKRLLERQFLWVSSAAERVDGGEVGGKDHGSVCLESMVQGFIEENHYNNEKSQFKRCNCFQGCNSNDEFKDVSGREAYERLKSLVHCTTVKERNLLAQTWKIIEANKACKKKDGMSRRTISESLISLGYDASVCKSQWSKSASYPAGEYEYMDVTVECERYIIDVDFRSEFEIARSTRDYKVILHTLPYVFVGTADRLQKIVTIVSDAAKLSLKKKGMPFPPWRKADYVKAKWLSPYSRLSPTDQKSTYPEQAGNNNKLGLVPEDAEDGWDGWKLPEIKIKTPTRKVNGLATVMQS